MISTNSPTSEQLDNAMSEEIQKINASLRQGDWCPRVQNMLRASSCFKMSRPSDDFCRQCPRMPPKPADLWPDPEKRS